MKKIVPIIILTIISALFIFYRFVDIPKYLAPDEVDFARLAFSLENKPYAPYSQLATGHSTLYFYALLGSLKTFGINTFALRFPSAIFGVLSVIMFYLIMQSIYQKNKILDTKYLILNTFILLSSRWFLNFARFSFEATFLLFLELVSIYFLIKFESGQKAKISIFETIARGPFGVWRSKKYDIKLFYLTISGLFAGLAFLSYTPGRIFFILPLSFMILSFSQRRKSSVQGSVPAKAEIRSGMRHVLYFLIPFIIIITPLTNYLINNKDNRIDQQFLLMNHEMPLNEKISGLLSNISSTTLMFFTKGDMNGRHNYPGKPALNPILGTLFIIGLIISIKNFKNLYNKLFLFYFLISLFPALMTYPWENPNMLRTYTVLPSVVYFIGIAIYYFVAIALRSSSNKKTFVLCFLFLIILFSSYYELRTYFIYQPLSFKHSFNQPDYLPIIYKNAQNQQK